MTLDPFFIEGPAVISFSGGRTSGYMLHKIVERGLQPDVYVLYCNTGREDDRTLDFVRDCAKRFDVPIRYLEYRRRFLPVYKSEEVAAASDLLRKHFGCTPFFEAADGRTEPGFIEVD